MSHVARLVVGRVEIVDPAFQAGIHYGEILVGECHVDYHFGLVAAEEFAELFHAVGIHAVGGDYRQVGLPAFCGGFCYGLCQGVAFGLTARCDYDFGEHFRVLGAFVGYHAAHASGADNDNFCHSFNLFFNSPARSWRCRQQC